MTAWVFAMIAPAEQKPHEKRGAHEHTRGREQDDVRHLYMWMLRSSYLTVFLKRRLLKDSDFELSLVFLCM